MENTVNARFECTYTLAHVLSLGHNCMLMITVIKNAGFFIFFCLLCDMGSQAHHSLCCTEHL